MPELAEVKISADLIRPLVVGKTVSSIHTTPNSRYGYDNLMPIAYRDDALPIIVQSVKTKGKFMYWTFKHQGGSEFWMFATFGMSGQFSPVKGKHPCMEMKFADAPPVYFNDPRHFGTIKIVSDPQDLSDKLKALGWDALQDKIEDYLPRLISSLDTNKPISQMLMNQKVFAGIGNYLRAEVLYALKMSPWRCSSSLTIDDIKQLCQTATMIVQQSYEHQGATISTYKTAYGEEGKYSGLFKCYGRKQDDLGNPIIKEETPEGRIMHWCPSVQT